MSKHQPPTNTSKLGSNKRSHTQKERDRVDIAELYLKGRTLRDISKWIGENRPYTLSHESVCNDLLVVR